MKGSIVGTAMRMFGRAARSDPKKAGSGMNDGEIASERPQTSGNRPQTVKPKEWKFGRTFMRVLPFSKPSTV